MSKFSVKKPLTVFVAVIAILVLGFVAYTKMTPDLLPNMDFPYVIVVTAYPGASPEKVEAEISKPMEQSMARLEHIKTISSTSSENVSMLMMEFETSVNMDTIGVDIQQNVTALQGGWPETVAAPYILKINPSMLPIAVAGLSMEGKDTIALTDFLNETLMTKLEGIPGVARVSATGMVEQELHVILDQKKLDALNAKIVEAIDKQLDEALDDLKSQKNKLTSAKNQLNEAKNQISAALSGNMGGMGGIDNSQQTEMLQKAVAAGARLSQLRQFENEYQRYEALLDSEDEQIVIEAYAAIAQLDVQLAALGHTRDELPAAIMEAQNEVEYYENEAKALGEQLAAAAGQLLQMGGVQAELAVNANTVSQALTQIESGIDKIKDSRKTTIKQTDLNEIITMDMVKNILTAQNFSMPAGYVKEKGVSYMVSVGDEIKDLHTLQNLLLMDLGLEDIDPIYLKDVATVIVTDNHEDTYARLNGKDGVMLNFEKQSTYATAEATENIAQRFAQLEQEYPGLHFVMLMNQGDYIFMIVESIISSLLLGAVFAIIVLYLFLRDLRPTFITLCSIPISVVFAIVLMYFSGVTLNMISLSGLAVAVGMLVDNSVVVIENIYRLRDKGANAIQAAVSGAGQVLGSVTASTLTTVCVFLPIVFVEGITRQLFTDLALTMSYALLASLIVSLTLVPAMAAGMLKKKKESKPGLLNRKLLPAYEKAVRWTLSHKAVVLIAAVVLLFASAALALARGFIFMPEMDSNTITINVTMPEGATMAESADYADEVLRRIETLDGVQTVGAMMGSGSMLSGISGSGSKNVSIYVTLADENASGAAFGREVESLCKDMGCEVSASASMMSMSALTGSGVSMTLYSEDMDALTKAAKASGEIFAGIEGIGEVDNGLQDSEPALHIRVDRNKAMEKGLTVAQIYMDIAAGLTDTSTIASLQLDGVNTDIIVSKPSNAVLDGQRLRYHEFEVNKRDGGTKKVRMKEIAEVVDTTSLSSISRTNQKRNLSVTGAVLPGYNVTLLTAQVQAAIEAADLGQGVSYKFSGENESIMEAMTQLFYMLLLGILLVYLVMVAQFQSLKSPFIVMFTIPLAFTGGFLGLLLTGMEVSVISMIGFVMLTGIIVNNGIVLVDYINQLRIDGVERREAIVEAGITRMRPILMTTITTILGLADMALRTSTGTAMMKPIAIVCIGGLVYATLMTLFVVPCIYDILNKKEIRTVSEEDLELLNI